MSRMFLGEKNKGCKIVKRRKIIISIPDSHFQKKKKPTVFYFSSVMDYKYYCPRNSPDVVIIE
jgi:hypothetical protein